MVYCSSINTCYDHDFFRYDNNNCKNTYESCGSWSTDGKVLEGCILSKFCGTTGEYLSDDDVEFRCPDEKKTWPDDEMEGWTRQFNMDNRVWELVDLQAEYEKLEQIEKQERDKIEGEALDYENKLERLSDDENDTEASVKVFMGRKDEIIDGLDMINS